MGVSQTRVSKFYLSGKLRVISRSPIMLDEAEVRSYAQRRKQPKPPTPPSVVRHRDSVEVFLDRLSLSHAQALVHETYRGFSEGGRKTFSAGHGVRLMSFQESI